MNLESVRELEEKLENMSRQELTKFTKLTVCRKLYSNGPGDSGRLDPGTVLDLIHTEYLRRGLEKHYDMTFESVTKNPDVCDAA